MRTRLLLPLVLVGLGLGACSDVASLGEDRPALSEEELPIVRSKVDQALEEGSWAAAWDEAVRAGATQERLEAIAIEALAPANPDLLPAPKTAVKMFDQLRSKYGSLTSASRAEVTRRSEAAFTAKRWMEAVEMELAALDEPPAYDRVWDFYHRAPSYRAGAIATRIQEDKDARRKPPEDAEPGSGD